MTAWTTDELTRIASADEVQIAPRRRDGTLRNPRTIWVVRHGGDLYVRSVNGRTSSSGSVAPRHATKATSGPAASTKTCAWSR